MVPPAPQEREVLARAEEARRAAAEKPLRMFERGLVTVEELAGMLFLIAAS